MFLIKFYMCIFICSFSFILNIFMCKNVYHLIPIFLLLVIEPVKVITCLLLCFFIVSYLFLLFPLPSFRIHYQPLVVTTSCLDVASKNKLKNVIHKLGGHLVSEWQPSCTHLVMSLVKVTIKVLAL